MPSSVPGCRTIAAMDRSTFWVAATLVILAPFVAHPLIASPGDADETGIVTVSAADLA